MIIKIIFTVFFGLLFILLLYEAFHAICKRDNGWAILCSISSGLIGMIFGILLGSLLF